MNQISSMNISLPRQMKDWVEEKANSGKFSNTSDYVRDLIRKDQDRDEKIAGMQALVDDARQSGLSERSMEELRTVARSTFENET
jgi:antitoxin ParD1/3/4